METQQHTILSATQEHALFAALAAGDRSARTTLCLHNQRLVAKIASRYRGRGVSDEDLFQEGMIGLLTAIDHFDPKRGNKLSTMAVWWIRQAVTRAIADQGRIIRVPVHIYEDLVKVKRAQMQSLGMDDPSLEALAQMAALPYDRVVEVLTIPADARSLDRVLGDDPEGTTLAALVADSQDHVAITDSHLTAHEAVEWLLHGAGLTRTERTILTTRYGLGRDDGVIATFRATGDQLGRSFEGVRQIEARALRKLRVYAASHRDRFQTIAS